MAQAFDAAFLVPRDALTPRHRLALDVDPAAGVVRAGDLAAYRSAEQAVALAQEQAQAIVADAQAAFEEERRRGYDEGMELACREGAEHMARQVAHADAYFAQIEDRLVGLVMQAVRKIVADYSERDRVVHSVRNALAVVRNQKQITLRLNPDNVEHVKARTRELLNDYPGVGLLDVVADPQVEGDCCILESEIGVVEASTAGQLAALEAAFRNVLEARG